ncbi:MAG TPA: hypothetical protein VIJ92_05295 [Ginsengibacter sp.]
MQIYENSRRNFISNIAFLSAGIMFKPAINHLPSLMEPEDLQKKWELFWKKSGGQKIYSLIDLQKNNILSNTKGHVYNNGEVICFSKENILAQPTWIYWKNNKTRPADVVISLFEKNSLKKIARLNRFEADAIYKVSKDYGSDNLLEAHCNNLKPATGNTIAVLKNKLSVNKNSQVQQVSYYKNHSLVIDKKFIYHS